MPQPSNTRLVRESDVTNTATPTGLAIVTAIDDQVTTAIANSTTLAVTLDRLPTGSTITIDKVKGGYGAVAGTWPTTRPTARLDIYVVWTGDTDPGSIAIGGDKWDREI